MNVLIASHHLNQVGGSESFTKTMADIAEKMGDNVTVYTRIKGPYAQTIKHKVVDRLDQLGSTKFDLSIISHNTVLGDLSFIEGPKIFVSHGTVPLLEKPIKGADKYVGISSEVVTNMIQKGFNPSLILNPIDTWEYRSILPTSATPTNVLVISDSISWSSMIRSVCKTTGMEFRHISKVRRSGRVRDDINWADVVFSLGRGAMEAMSCGRNVYVGDHRGYQDMLCDGMLSSYNAKRLIVNNFSGRTIKLKPTQEEIVKDLVELRGLNHRKISRLNRWWASTHLDSEVIYNQYKKLGGAY